MSERRIEYDIVEAPPGEAVRLIQAKLNGYLASYGGIYIGLTANPEARWRRHESAGWRKMVVLYRAYSPDIGRSVETELIEYARGCNFVIDVENVTAGGDGILDRNGHHFIYILVKDGAPALRRRGGRGGRAPAWP